jgi:GNAT superfamily N-acetyltransferase
MRVQRSHCLRGASGICLPNGSKKAAKERRRQERGAEVSDPNKDGPSTRSVLDRLAHTLPDIPRWLYVRSMLLSGRCEVLGLAEGGPEPQFVVRELEESEDRTVCVVGRPPADAIREATRRNRDGGEILTTPEGASLILSALPDWTATRATLHLLGDASRLPRIVEGEVRPFGASDLATVADELPEELRSELEGAIARGAHAVAASADGRPVSFCYAADETEGLWDISIDTLEPYRRQGYAARCVSYMVDKMRRRGKEPVWAAEVTNLTSMRLATKLGFVPVDELLLFRPSA